MKKLKRNGFTLIEALFGLLITSIISSLCCMLIAVECKTISLDVDAQNQFAILQLRQLLSLSESIEIQNDDLIFIQNHEKIRLYYHAGRIVRSPGYEIFMEGVNHVQFFKKENCYFVSYNRSKKFYTYQLY